VDVEEKTPAVAMHGKKREGRENKVRNSPISIAQPNIPKTATDSQKCYNKGGKKGRGLRKKSRKIGES